MVHISQGDSKTELGTQCLLQASPSVSKHGPQLAVSALPENLLGMRMLKISNSESKRAEWVGWGVCVCQRLGLGSGEKLAKGYKVSATQKYVSKTQDND